MIFLKSEVNIYNLIIYNQRPTLCKLHINF